MDVKLSVKTCGWWCATPENCAWPVGLRVVRVVAFESPSAIDFVSGAEIVIDLDVELFACIGGAETKPIVGAVLGLRPLKSGSVQAVAGSIIVRLRHHAEDLIDITGRIHLRPVGIPTGSRLDECGKVGAIRIGRRQVRRQRTEHARIVQGRRRAGRSCSGFLGVPSSLTVAIVGVVPVAS